ncbi:MAG: T9SS type A sorting domain-containing protein [Lewinellaceae bacterium]|nr:T9SS type A sorting domain-containing protein [Lewinellaceae bacterium]
MFIFDFDRCTGQLSNFRHVDIEHNDNWDSFGGMSFSPNSRFIYTFHGKYCYQVDLEAPDIQASVAEVGYWDGTLVANFFPTYFGKAALAPDGKIYAACTGSTPFLHVIHSPDAKGLNCQLEQHGITLPYSLNTNTMPNFPNFRLGPVVGSACDTITASTMIPQQLSRIIKIQPNPTTGSFHLLLPDEMDTDVELRLFDVAGRLRWQQSPKALSDLYQLPADITPGCYLLEVRSPQGVRIGFKRLIMCR